VLARTTQAPWPRLWASFRRLLLRPTFALEGAYLGSVVLVALVGLPRSPLRDVPRRIDGRVSGVVQSAEASAERGATRLAVEVAELRHRVETKFEAVVRTMEPDGRAASSDSDESADQSADQSKETP
jgi:hypothetical protein